MKYYIDSCIWRDYLENRSDRFRPLGDWALALINKIIEEEGIVIYSQLILKELIEYMPEQRIKDMLNIFPLKIKVKISKEQFQTARQVSRKTNIPKNDVLHAILAGTNNAVLVTRDKHFYELQKFAVIKKPEELI